MEMKSKQVIEKPRIDQYIHELSHKPIDVKQRLKVEPKERVHARIAAKYKSRKTV